MPHKDPEKQKEYRHQYYLANQKKIKTRAKMYYLKNYEIVQKQNRERYLNNKDAYQERNKAWREKHREQSNHYNRIRKLEYRHGSLFALFWKNIERNINKKTTRERQREWERNNYDRIKKQNRERYLKNLVERKIYRKKYYLENKEKIRRYRLENQDKIKQSKKEYRVKNRDKIKEYDAKQWQTCREKRQGFVKKWRRNNPEKCLRVSMKYVEKLAKPWNMRSYEMMGAVIAWSKTIKKNNRNKCAICQDAVKESHHILYKKYYPELCLNVNNGIALCQRCHYEVHGKNLKGMKPIPVIESILKYAVQPITIC